MMRPVVTFVALALLALAVILVVLHTEGLIR